MYGSANWNYDQNANKPTKLSKLRRNSNVPPAPPIPIDQPRRPKAPALSPLAAQRQLSSQTNTCPRTRSCSCGIYPTPSIKIHSLLCLVVSRDSWRLDWCQDERGLLSSSMRMSLGLLVPRRLPRGCLWEMASPSGLRTRDSEGSGCSSGVWKDHLFFFFF